MVAIKCLAILLFAAAVTAIPVAGDEHHDAGHDINLKDSSLKCKIPEQTLFCCNNARDTEATGIFAGVLDTDFIKCDALPINTWTVDAIIGQNKCKGKTACCHSESHQDGQFNIVTDCVSVAGIN
ncbi:hypothetical protein L873DRAFT_1843365 [Choiromyces venosus 120613-1]|uniref:Hydrophobin n=1 Tax=Choiromyces venosus 120613-1 TaxID=1336337 RepID=A0A3N4JQZ5_9PEZI|nr:hypothetical protein L873DRAFT_1843365 [Choiromyces venosus 120613-1]